MVTELAAAVLLAPSLLRFSLHNKFRLLVEKNKKAKHARRPHQLSLFHQALR